MSVLLQQLCQPCVSAALSRVVFSLRSSRCATSRGRTGVAVFRPPIVGEGAASRVRITRARPLLFVFCLHAFTHVAQFAVSESIRGEGFGLRTFTFPSPVGCFADRSFPRRKQGEGAEGEGSGIKVFTPNRMKMRRFRHVGEGVKTKNENRLMCA